jgi:uncharacterized delta-60 repeat protein
VVGGGSGFIYDFTLVRYLPNGTPDTSFGNNGIVVTDFGAGTASQVLDLAIQPDGKIVAVGWQFEDGEVPNLSFALARYHSNGALDTSFGGDGRVVTDFGNARRFDEARAVALQPDGRIVVVGVASPGGFLDGAVARYLSNGALDTTFSGDGKATVDWGVHQDEEIGSIALQSDNKIVIAGTALIDFGDEHDFALARLLPNGALDSTFGTAGTVITSLRPRDDAAAVAIQADDKIVVVGTVFTPAANNVNVGLTRYTKNGALDTSFSSYLNIVSYLRGNNDIGNALVIQPKDGRLVVAGMSNFSDSSTFMMARYHAITCSGVVVTQIGTASNDTIVGTPDHDVIFGFGGNDTISGLGGDNILCGGSGHDSLSGGPGTDTCNGGSPGSGDTETGCEQIMGCHSMPWAAWEPPLPFLSFRLAEVGVTGGMGDKVTFVCN